MPQKVYDKILFLIITDQVRTSKYVTITQRTTEDNNEEVWANQLWFGRDTG